jgi:HEPN domain-containing protein
MDSLRSFLETTLKRYLGKIGQSPSTNGKFTFLEQALKKLKSVEENGGSAEIVQNVELLLQDKLLMDAVNHNPSFIPDEDKIKDLADRMIRLLEYIFEQYEKYKNDQNKNT